MAPNPHAHAIARDGSEFVDGLVTRLVNLLDGEGTRGIVES